MPQNSSVIPVGRDTRRIYIYPASPSGRCRTWAPTLGSAKASSGPSPEACPGQSGQWFWQAGFPGGGWRMPSLQNNLTAHPVHVGWSLTYKKFTDHSNSRRPPCGITKEPEQGMASQRRDAKLSGPLSIQLLHKGGWETPQVPRQLWCLFLRLDSPGTPSKLKLTSMDSLWVLFCFVF